MTIMIGHGKKWWSNDKDMIFGADKYTRPKKQNKTKQAFWNIIYRLLKSQRILKEDREPEAKNCEENEDQQMTTTKEDKNALFWDNKFWWMT